MEENAIGVYLPWSRLNKESWEHDLYRTRTLCESQSLRGKTLAEISPQMIENFKIERAKFITRRHRLISAGTINNEFALLSRIMRMVTDRFRSAG